MYRILIVEDDPTISAAVAEQMKLWDLEAICVQKFRNVMGEFAQCNPHLVLLDISLPFFNGYHWCGEIRKVSKVPIINSYINNYILKNNTILQNFFYSYIEKICKHHYYSINL